MNIFTVDVFRVCIEIKIYNCLINKMSQIVSWIQERMDSLSTKNVQKYGSTYQALDNLTE